MVGTIRPLVQGLRKQTEEPSTSPWQVSLAFHALGSLIGATAMGALVGAAGLLFSPGLNSPWTIGLIGSSSALYALHEFRLLALPYPQLNRQVQQHWRHIFKPHLLATLFGLQLGAGYATFIATSTLYIVTVVAFLSASFWFSLVAFLLFAIARVGFLGVLAGSAGNIERVVGTSNVLLSTKALMHIANGSALVLVAGASIMNLIQE